MALPSASDISDKNLLYVVRSHDDLQWKNNCWKTLSKRDEAVARDALKGLNKVS
jgi:hypothetical protein